MFAPISWTCKKQTLVSHSTTEAELMSLDAGLRVDGIPALVLWDLVIEALTKPAAEPLIKPSVTPNPKLGQTSDATGIRF